VCAWQSVDDKRTLRVYGAAFSAFDESKVHRLATCVSMLVRGLWAALVLRMVLRLRASWQQYVSFDVAVAKALKRLSVFPKLTELQFRFNNLHSLHQLRSLASRLPPSVTKLTVLNNSVVRSPLFRPYVAHCMPVSAARWQWLW